MKQYLLRFGSDNPANHSGLSPTFTNFHAIPGSSFVVVAPSITETGSGEGCYTFGWTATTFPVYFKVDGGATQASTDRYVVGILDPVQAVDEKIGWLTDSFGSTAVDPASVIGYLKRNLEVNEGNAAYQKSNAAWTVQARGASGVVLFTKTLVNNSVSVTKT